MLVLNYPYCLVDIMRFKNLSICIKMVNGKWLMIFVTRIISLPGAPGNIWDH